MSNETERETLERLRAISWHDDDAKFRHSGSRAALMREFLRRAALWAEALDATDVWPFFDIAERIDSETRAEESVTVELDEYLWNNVGRKSIETTCRSAVQWAALDSRTEIPFDLPHPFEPLMLMYERGGGFVIESVFIDLTGAMLPFRSGSEYVSADPIPGCDEETLNLLDAGEGR